MSDSADDPWLDFARVWKSELDRIIPSRGQSRSMTDEAVPHAALVARVDRHNEPIAALCLSGGGIRSASFALGVLQALTRCGLLDEFHYLSSVSGGGFIGSWLTAWRHAAGDDQVVKDGLLRLQTKGLEAPEIQQIRADSNYLTPQLGLISADTWTVMALYMRNLILNWCIYFPLLLGVMFIPRACLSLLQTARGWLIDATPTYPPVGALLALLFFAIASSNNALSRAAYGTQRLTTKGYFTWILLPTVIATSLLTCVDSPLIDGFSWLTVIQFAAAAGGVVNAIATVCCTVAVCGTFHQAVGRRLQFTLAAAAWVLSGAITGALIGAIIYDFVHVHQGSSFQVVVELSGIVLSLFVGELLYVGTTSFVNHSEQEREWLARSTGWLCAIALVWLLWAGTALYGPWIANVLMEQAAKSAAAVTGVSGALTLVLGWSDKTAALTAQHPKLRPSLRQLAGIAGLVFALSIAVVFARLALQLEVALVRYLTWRVVLVDALAAVGCLLLAAGISRGINVNRFSLHALYRNRLIRAFLGSARACAAARRDPDPFTGFDTKDNLRMADLHSSNPARLFHVINTTLNVLSSKNPAWQERKAESFVITPLACGNPQVGFRKTEFYGARDRGITLGTAMAISGAAVSPNQGYNSSPLISILLMLFNIRLGWWLGHPQKPNHKLEGPRFGLEPALRELAGATSDTNDWLYLSDGGHFENLGLYEMVRRRCRRIVISDAGCDPQCTFEDLGNAARKCFIDFGVRIEFKAIRIAARETPPRASARMAVGIIRYPEGKPGKLIYIKPTYFGTEPPEIRSYAAANATFPHETTTDQWFSESQLEAYRALGAHAVEHIGSHNPSWFNLGRRDTEITLDQFFDAAEHLATHDQE